MRKITDLAQTVSGLIIRPYSFGAGEAAEFILIIRPLVFDAGGGQRVKQQIKEEKKCILQKRKKRLCFLCKRDIRTRKSATKWATAANI